MTAMMEASEFLLKNKVGTTSAIREKSRVRPSHARRLSRLVGCVSMELNRAGSSKFLGHQSDKALKRVVSILE